MKKFTFYEVKVEEIEPGIVITDYGSQLVTPVLLADLLDRLLREWGETKIAMLTIAPSATEMGNFTAVIEEKNVSGFSSPPPFSPRTRCRESSSASSMDKNRRLTRGVFSKRRKKPSPGCAKSWRNTDGQNAPMMQFRFYYPF